MLKQYARNSGHHNTTKGVFVQTTHKLKSKCLKQINTSAQRKMRSIFCERQPYRCSFLFWRPMEAIEVPVENVLPAASVATTTTTSENLSEKE